MNRNCKSGNCGPRRPSPAQQQKLVTDWNAAYPPGTEVNVQKDNGAMFPTKTRSQAWLMGEHTAVIMLDGIAGAYSLERVTVKRG